MSRHFACKLNLLALAIPLWAFAFSGTACAATGTPDQNNASQARALKATEMKLAALAKEAGAEGPSEAAAKQKAAAPKVAKKKSHPVRKKTVAKSKRQARTKLAGNGGPQRIVARRLTRAEVQGILSTTRDFSGSDLSGMNLAGEDLSGTKFIRANLHSANLERADLAESDLELADLSGANLRGASLNQARLYGTRLEGTSMEGALWIDRTICRKGSVGSCIE